MPGNRPPPPLSCASPPLAATPTIHRVIIIQRVRQRQATQQFHCEGIILAVTPAGNQLGSNLIKVLALFTGLPTPQRFTKNHRHPPHGDQLADSSPCRPVQKRVLSMLTMNVNGGSVVAAGGCCETCAQACRRLVARCGISTWCPLHLGCCGCGGTWCRGVGAHTQASGLLLWLAPAGVMGLGRAARHQVHGTRWQW